MSNINELIPVKYKKHYLTPTTRGRAYHLVSVGKAVWFKDKRGTTCIRMKVEPSNDVINETVLGVDPGTLYDGYTVSNDKGQFNAELTYTDKVKNRNFIKETSKRRRDTRRMKRSRLRHRKTRFDNRIGNKETKTSVYYRQHRQNQLSYFKKLFNIGEIVIEDVKFNHYNDPDIIDKLDFETGEILGSHRKGRSFSPIEVGKNKLYKWIREVLLIEPQLIKGYETSEERKLYFKGEVKNKAKDNRDFFTHCVDSFILSTFVDDFKLQNKIVHFWNRITFKVRRKLTRERNLYKGKQLYFRYDKGGKIRIIKHSSKLKKIRVKINDGKSNHGPWNYTYTDVVETFKKNIAQYGGTINRRNGMSKYWSPIGYIYYY